jgi:alpha-N-acetylglucosamine transferase
LNNADFESSNFNLIPNPAKNNLRIQSNNNPISKIEIFNVLGQQIISIDSDNLLSKNIDISSLNVGIYLVKINSSTTKRLIVK